MEISEEKNENLQNSSKNESKHEVSSKSDNGKVVKYRGKISGMEFRRKKRKSTNFHPKSNLCTTFHPNRTMGKWSNKGGTFSGGI